MKDIEHDGIPRGWDPIPVFLNNGLPAISPFDHRQYQMPRIVNIRENVARMESLRSETVIIALIPAPSTVITACAYALSASFRLFERGGPFDYQRTPSGLFLKAYRPFASFHYGLMMAAAGLEIHGAEIAAGLYNRTSRSLDTTGAYGNSRQNQVNMEYGYRVFKDKLLP